MDKSFNINTQEYQEAQEAFFIYNVEGNMRIPYQPKVGKMIAEPSFSAKEAI